MLTKKLQSDFDMFWKQISISASFALKKILLLTYKVLNYQASLYQMLQFFDALK